MNTSEISKQPLPIRGILSVALMPMVPLFGALAIVIAQYFVNDSDGLSINYFSQLSQIGVFVQLVFFIAGVIFALISLLKREHLRSIAILGLIMNVLLIGIFLYARFYALGFDQDTGAPPL